MALFKTSVDSIIGGVHKAVAKLEAHRDNQRVLMDKHTAAIMDLHNKRAGRRQEHDYADRMIANIKSLIGTRG